MAFKQISLLWNAKGHEVDTAFFPGQKKKKKNISPGHVGDSAFLPGRKTHITTFGALGDFALESTYDVK